MMCNKKRMLAIGLAIVLALSCGIGCGKKPVDTVNTENSEDLAKQELTKDTEKDKDSSKDKDTETKNTEGTESTEAKDSTENTGDTANESDSSNGGQQVADGDGGSWGEIDEGDPDGSYGYYEYTPEQTGGSGANLCMTRGCSQEAIDKAQSIAANFGGSDYDKVRGIHDYIINNSYYYNDSSMTCHSADGIILYNYGVCESYTNAFNLICYYAGVETAIEFGYANGGDHCWSLVKIDGSWYEIDVTWDDPVMSNGGSMLRYDYFLITTSKMSEDHAISYNTGGITCTNTGYMEMIAAEQLERDKQSGHDWAVECAAFAGYTDSVGDCKTLDEAKSYAEAQALAGYSDFALILYHGYLMGDKDLQSIVQDNINEIGKVVSDCVEADNVTCNVNYTNYYMVVFCNIE